MKLRTQILGLGLAGAALAAGVGGLGLLSTGRLGQSMQSAVQAGEALQASQEADMMHDAIRGDALRAMLAMLEKQTDDAAEAAKALKEHVQTFDKALAHLGELPLTDETRRQLESVRPLVQRYEQVADATIAQWRAGDPAARATTQSLQQAFTQLETAMASLSDSIEKHNDALKDDAGQNVRRTGLALGAALATITALMLAASLLLARRMAAPIDKAVEAAERLAQGDLSGHIRPSGNDESRQLLTAMARMQTELTGIIGAVKSGAEQVATASAQIAKGNEELAGRTGQQAGSRTPRPTRCATWASRCAAMPTTRPRPTRWPRAHRAWRPRAARS